MKKIIYLVIVFLVCIIGCGPPTPTEEHMKIAVSSCKCFGGLSYVEFERGYKFLIIRSYCNTGETVRKTVKNE
jgi:hypothetical protein